MKRFDARRTHRRYIDRERSQVRQRARRDKVAGLIPFATLREPTVEEELADLVDYQRSYAARHAA